MDANLALAIAVSTQSPTLREQLATTATKLIQKHFTDKASLADLRSLQRSHGDAVAQVLSSLPPPALTKLVKRLDPHNPASKAMGRGAAVPHLGDLIRGASEPTPPQVKTPKPKAAGKGGKAGTANFAEVVRYADANARLAGLKTLAVGALKAGIRDESIHPEGVPKGAGKEDLIAHIEKIIRMGWPGPLDVMVLSRR